MPPGSPPTQTPAVARSGHAKDVFCTIVTGSLTSTMTDTTAARPSTTLRWLAVVVWIALIYTTIPFVRALQTWFTARWDKQLIGYAVVAVLVVAAVTVLLALRRLSSRPSLATAAWLVVVAAVYAWWAISLFGVPEESVHLLEYGVLGVLLYRALRPRIPDATVYLVAALIGLLVGTVDEIIQWITPLRYFDFRDVFLNTGSCALALVAVWKIEGASPLPVTSRSWQRAVRWTIAVVALFTLVLSTTPTRVQRWAVRFPGVPFLRSPDNAMAEYGYRHVVPEIGQFKSRLTIEELRAEDSARAGEVAEILGRYPDTKYGRFLKKYPPSSDPFAHEVRVHIFSRDRHLRERSQHIEGSRDSRHHASVALRQHQILERFFGNTLHNSVYDLPEATIQDLELQQLPAFLWASRTSRHLITWISERALRVALIVSLVVLAALDLWLGRRGRERAEVEGVHT